MTRTSDRLRLAIIGPAHPHGWGWRETFLREDGIDVVALVTAADGKVGALQEPYADVPLFRRIDELLDGPAFDAALVCLLNNETVEVCCRLAEAGKHLLLEKPVAGSADDMQTIATAMDRAGVVGQVAYQWRFNPASQGIRRLIDDGAFGRLWSLETRMLATTVASRGPDHDLFSKAICGGGFFNWLGCHWFDLMNYLAGEYPLAVTGRVAKQTAADVDVEDMGVAVLEYPSGLVASLHAGYVWGKGKDLYVGLRGECGAVDWDASEMGFTATSTCAEWSHMPERKYRFHVDTSYGYGGAVTSTLIADWLAGIRTGRPTHSSPANNVRVLEIIDSLYASSESGQRVVLAADRGPFSSSGPRRRDHDPSRRNQ